MKSYESNKNFTLINNGKLAFKKSSPDNDNFDVLFFADKSLTEVVIPKFVRFIAPYSFFKCGLIVKVEFEKNSQLQEIGRNAFAFNHFTKIEIPPSLKHICRKLQNLNFERLKFLQNLNFEYLKEIHSLDLYLKTLQFLRNL